LNVKQFHAVTHPKFEAAEIDTPKFAVELMADPREWEAAKNRKLRRKVRNPQWR